MGIFKCRIISILFQKCQLSYKKNRFCGKPNKIFWQHCTLPYSFNMKTSRPCMFFEFYQIAVYTWLHKNREGFGIENLQNKERRRLWAFLLKNIKAWTSSRSYFLSFKFILYHFSACFGISWNKFCSKLPKTMLAPSQLLLDIQTLIELIK